MCVFYNRVFTYSLRMITLSVGRLIYYEFHTAKTLLSLYSILIAATLGTINTYFVNGDFIALK